MSFFFFWYYIFFFTVSSSISQSFELMIAIELKKKNALRHCKNGNNNLKNGSLQQEPFKGSVQLHSRITSFAFRTLTEEITDGETKCEISMNL